MTTLNMILTMTIKEDMTEEFDAFFADMQAKVAAEEPGTLRFEANRVRDNPKRYVMIEEYADQAAWDFHSVKQGERGVVPEMVKFADGPPEFMFLLPSGRPFR